MPEALICSSQLSGLQACSNRASLVTAHLGSGPPAPPGAGAGASSVQGDKSRGREGRKRAWKESSLVWTGCQGKLWGNQVWEGDLSTIWGDGVPWNPPTQKKERSQFPEIMGFQLSVILTLLCLFMVFQTNKTHPVWQAQPSLLTRQCQQGLRNVDSNCTQLDHLG